MSLEDAAVDLPPIVAPPPIPPGVPHWHGAATGSWWAMVPSRRGPRLVEAASEHQLAAEVDSHLRAIIR